MNNLLFRCSSLYKIMSNGKKTVGLTKREAEKLEELIKKEANKRLTANQKKEKERLLVKRDFKPDFDLSQGARTYIESLVKQQVYGYTTDFQSKQTEKGVFCENDSIELYNNVYFSNYEKNTVSKENDWIKGTCDIDCARTSMIIDIKTSWSKETFPATTKEVEIGGYEWQGRGYMMLYDRAIFRLAFCLIETPEHLLVYEKNKSIHFIDDSVPLEHRLTVMDFERCKEKEEKIKYKVEEARRYAKYYYEMIVSRL